MRHSLPGRRRDSTTGTPLIPTIVGHLPALLVDADGKIQWLDHGGALPLGLFGDLSVSRETYATREGSVLVLYTDGITEAENSAKEHFGLERLGEVVASHRAENPTLIHSAIRSTLEEFVGNEKLSDDTTLVVMKF